METQTLNNEETMATQAINEGKKPSKTFTQDEVNNIVAERVARVKTDKEQEYNQKLEELNRQSLQLQAKEVLISKGMPEELLNAVSYSDIETFNKNIEIIEKYATSRGANRQHYEPVRGGNSSYDDNLRRAMGLRRC